MLNGSAIARVEAARKTIVNRKEDSCLIIFIDWNLYEKK